MPEGEAQPPVLRCIQCNKPFDKRESHFNLRNTNFVLTLGHSESTLKRHGYYCRSRKAGGSSRVRSCVSCAKGKARCDGKRPDCSRCLSRGIQCHYPENSRSDVGPKRQSEVLRNEPHSTTCSSVAELPVEPRPLASHDNGTVLDSALSMPLENLGEEFLDWNDAELDFSDFLNAQTLIENVDYSSSGTSLFRRSNSTTYQTNPVHYSLFSPEHTMPPTPSIYNTRSLVLRSKITGGATRSANLILGTLKSYPHMILRDNTLPPFIHPSLVPFHKEDDEMEPLTNCISLVHMVSSGIRGSKKLFWRNVRMECERLRAEVCFYFRSL